MPGWELDLLWLRKGCVLSVNPSSLGGIEGEKRGLGKGFVFVNDALSFWSNWKLYSLSGCVFSRKPKEAGLVCVANELFPVLRTVCEPKTEEGTWRSANS